MEQNKKPLYVQIREYIREQIDSGVLKEGDQIPTEAELMAHFKVSRVTITTAIKHLVKEGLVFRIAGKGTFVRASDMNMNMYLDSPHVKEINIKMIGFIMLPFWDSFTYRLLYGVEEACREAGYTLIVKSVFTQGEEQTAIREMVAAGAMGLIICPVDGESYNDEILQLRSSNFPFVLVDRFLPGIQTNAVYSDHYQGGGMGTEYLASLGHRKIGIVSSVKSKTSSAEERFRGYLDFARHKMLQVEPRHWLTRMDDDMPYHDEINSMDHIREWLTNNPDLTAVFALNPLDAVYVAKVAESMNFRIPEDLVILSFDDPGMQDLHHHFFGFIEQNLEEVGTRAVDLLSDTIHDPATLRQIKIPVTLRPGNSTGNKAFIAYSDKR
ncbi:GntR family transcriptional regulator [Cohnella silvisoli]|uniref:GntR family transcriptional regulator n=1 Tax=Cohnella silvisoli TaxID=2873699 RepID=A0ABV1L3V2_9BACL|nr:GntR family transcriptional regulator [Cohnella silvisoli]MCD9025786.1 GntR family transcriptional regulator [Cohnella silvisoli]